MKKGETGTRTDYFLWERFSSRALLILINDPSPMYRRKWDSERLVFCLSCLLLVSRCWSALHWKYIILEIRFYLYWILCPLFTSSCQNWCFHPHLQKLSPAATTVPPSVKYTRLQEVALSGPSCLPGSSASVYDLAIQRPSPLNFNLGWLWRAFQAPVFIVVSAEASITITLRVSFCLCPVLPPSLPYR